MRFLLGTAAYHKHVQNIALALAEVGVLGAYYSTGVDNYHAAFALKSRAIIEKFFPKLDRELSRRKITLISNDLVYSDWGWEGLRTIASRLGMSAVIQDWFWEKSERHLDLRCARLMTQQFDGFIGTEFGCLETLKVSKTLGKKSVVNYVSPHHLARKFWVDNEYYRFPELLTPYHERLLLLAEERDMRRDQEARLAEVIVANSELTAASLRNAGLDTANILVVPLGGIPPIPEELLPKTFSRQVRFIYAGNEPIRKGLPYLLEAWSLIGDTKTAELNLYGSTLLPKHYFRSLSSKVHFYGSVSQDELFKAYRAGSVFVFPTLLDGFGMVVLEAMAHGLPVITTSNAGAADLIEEGKNGFVIPPKNPEALADRLAWCIENPEALLDMRYHALNTARKQTWRHFRENLQYQLGQALGTLFEPLEVRTQV